MTPLGSLAFQYAEGIKGFTHRKVYLTWLSRVTQRLPPLTDLTSYHQHINPVGYLRFHTNVGVDYNGAAVEKTGDTVMTIPPTAYWAATLARWLTVTMQQSYHRTGWFHLHHHQRHHHGTTAVTDYSTLPEGIWSGDVAYSSTRPGPVNLSDVPAGVPPCFIPGRNCYEKAPSASRSLFSGISPAQALDVGDISSFRTVTAAR